ncbi:OPT oligopeptide transporter protein-domain-containing protein [Gilbertella persicaria]|uniref:OPT oligopeptide transporter protein-domain-containing protein n=1 Tax=Gilbertella persicaria TaxID=101096 RepID=UPI002220A1FD|nr:OPT oligopeptide transporter protein-domain-containing protein [Gilbertella persicaria]KAI8080101.1 OPT oligopeptide transporter protein-domain-containing protein [Gilbertella persicaria]
MLKFRSVVCGLMIGTLMCFSNMYFGLQTGWISMMSLQSSLLGFAIFKPFQPMLRHTFGPIENVVLQTTAVATATMPLAAGFVGVIPAMELMTKSDHPTGPVILSGQQLILWSLAVAFFGVFFAIPLRKQTIIREKLKFPSGTATAQMISLLHQIPDPTTLVSHSNSVRKRKRPEYQPLIQKTQTHYATVPQQNQASFEYSWSLKLHGLIASFTASSIYTLLSYFVPAINVLPVFNWLTFGYVDMRAWEWYFTPSFSYIGQGIIMGLPTTLSMLLGCVVGWGILSPMAYYAGWAPGPVDDWKTGSKGWILWISLGVMIAESCISLLIVLVKTIVKGVNQHIRYQDHESNTTETEEEEEKNDAPPHQQVPHWVTVVGLIASTLSCIYLVRFVFGPDVLPLSMSLLAVFVAMFLSILGVRALGETDLNPVSGIGKISQVLFAGVMPGGILANLIAGGIAEAGAQQAGDLMQDLKTGHLLKASPKAQFYGQMIGSFASVFIASGAYMLYRTVYSIPGPEFPVPTAQVWLDMSRLVNGHPLPPHVSEFVYAFAILFTLLVLIKELSPTNQRWTQWIPQGIAFAIGMYNPPNFTLARVIGGITVHYWNQYCDRSIDKHEPSLWIEPYRSIGGKVFMIVVASGFVLGEGTFAIVNMTMRACNVPHF